MSVDFVYKPRHFAHLPPVVTEELVRFVSRKANIVRLLTASSLGRPAIEGLSEGLVREFGSEIDCREAKQVAGFVVGQVMAVLGYEVYKRRARTRTGIFSTGAVFRPKRPIGADRFNLWVDERVRSPDGTLDPGKITQLAGIWGISFSAKQYSLPIRRVELGIKLRAKIPPSIYEPAEQSEEVRQGSALPAFPSIPDDQAAVEALVAKHRARP